jgi:hypothetical protein
VNRIVPAGLCPSDWRPATAHGMSNPSSDECMSATRGCSRDNFTILYRSRRLVCRGVGGTEKSSGNHAGARC